MAQSDKGNVTLNVEESVKSNTSGVLQSIRLRYVYKNRELYVIEGKKYEGLDGTELAISESQERMAVVIEEKDVEKFKKLEKKLLPDDINYQETQKVAVLMKGNYISNENYRFNKKRCY